MLRLWRCLESWAALRFSDHRCLSPTACRVTDGAFKAVLTRTKTTADKNIQSRVLHVYKDCWLVHPNWIAVGWNVWEEAAPWGTRLFPTSPNQSPEPLGTVRVQNTRKRQFSVKSMKQASHC